jgi:hypothetical protein
VPEPIDDPWDNFVAHVARLDARISRDAVAEIGDLRDQVRDVVAEITDLRNEVRVELNKLDAKVAAYTAIIGMMIFVLKMRGNLDGETERALYEAVSEYGALLLPP